jgi:hypothetical protein
VRDGLYLVATAYPCAGFIIKNGGRSKPTSGAKVPPLASFKPQAVVADCGLLQPIPLAHRL